MSKLWLAVLGMAVPLAPATWLNGWTTTLEAKGGSRVSGTARVDVVDGVTRASIDVRGAPARSTGIAWAIHAGPCDGLGPVHGNPNAYPPLVTDFTGETWEVATLTAPLTEGQQYSVVVHRSEDLTSAVAACGTLGQGGN